MTLGFMGDAALTFGAIFLGLVLAAALTGAGGDAFGADAFLSLTFGCEVAAEAFDVDVVERLHARLRTAAHRPQRERLATGSPQS